MAKDKPGTLEVKRLHWRGQMGWGDAARDGSFMVTPDEGSAYAPPPSQWQ